ncbi:MAG: AtpZ/AtpI family protein [Enhygromyxa sp.]
MSDPKPVEDRSTREVASEITRLEQLEREAKTRRGRNLWVQVSRVGTLGWLIALPIVGGALLGHLLDRRLGTGLTFTLAMLLLGLVIAGFTIWRHGQEFVD